MIEVAPQFGIKSDDTSETVYFERIHKDTHNAYDINKCIYTIPKSGFYSVTQYYEAGDIIEEPIMVRSLK